MYYAFKTYYQVFADLSTNTTVAFRNHLCCSTVLPICVPCCASSMAFLSFCRTVRCGNMLKSNLVSFMLALGLSRSNVDCLAIHLETWPSSTFRDSPQTANQVMPNRFLNYENTFMYFFGSFTWHRKCGNNTINRICPPLSKLVAVNT